MKYSYWLKHGLKERALVAYEGLPPGADSVRITDAVLHSLGYLMKSPYFEFAGLVNRMVEAQFVDFEQDATLEEVVKALNSIN